MSTEQDVNAPARPTDPHDRILAYRADRQEIERNVLPLASSVDGRRFEFQASMIDLAFEAGGYVVVEDGHGGRLGQVLSVRIAGFDSRDFGGPVGASAHFRAAAGEGIVLDAVTRPFHDATIRPALPAEVQAWLDANRPARAGLEIGQQLLASGVPATLDAGGFDRHTFLCGQSGSGKTYSLGLVLERLLLETDLRMIVLDPNSDYVRLGETRAGVAAELAGRYAEVARGIAVRRAGDGDDRIRLRVAELSPAARGALLQLDPIADREEYAALSAILESTEPGRQAITGLDDLLTADLPGARGLGLRASNLGVLDWSIWARGQAGSLIEDLERGDLRCLVVDLGSLETRGEQGVVAEAVLSTLWRLRARRQPVLVVIDEAHNICPAEPKDAVSALATDHVMRIAAEGRKFGLYLLVCTQRPQKVEANIVSQCDNLLLMRMNSAADLEYLRAVFSFVPGGLLDRSPAFRQGEALVGGKLVSHAGYVRFGNRVAEEGGADVPTAWARPH